MIYTRNQSLDCYDSQYSKGMSGHNFIQKLANEVLGSTFSPNIRYIIRLSLNTVVETIFFLLNPIQISWIALLLDLKDSKYNYYAQIARNHYGLHYSWLDFGIGSVGTLGMLQSIILPVFSAKGFSVI